MNALGLVRPAPAELKKKPAGMRIAANGMPLRASDERIAHPRWRQRTVGHQRR
jgi:hypothetical protein